MSGALPLDEAREAYSFEEIEAEQTQIQKAFQTMKFATQVRQNTIACLKKCGAQVKYPFRIEPAMLIGSQEVCFGDCLNINMEQGPYLRELGDVPEDAIPKKFIWSHSL